MRTMRIWGLISFSWLALVIMACGGSGDEPAVEEPASESSGGDPFGLVEAINNDLANASEQMGEGVEQANEGMAAGSEQVGDAVETAEGAMEGAGGAPAEGAEAAPAEPAPAE